MEQVREHFCWIKVVQDDGADADAGAARIAEVGGGVAMAMPFDWMHLPGRDHGVLNWWGPLAQGGVDPRPSSTPGGGHGPHHGGAGLHPDAGGDHAGFDEVLEFREQMVDKGGVDPRASSGGQSGGQGGGPLRAELGGVASAIGGSGVDQGGVDPRPGQPGGHGGRGALIFAGSRFMGAWRGDAIAAGSLGNPRLRILHRPVRGSLDEVLRWPDSAEGKAWLSGALAQSLISFVAIGDF